MICSKFVTDKLITNFTNDAVVFIKSPDIFYIFSFDQYNYKNFEIIWSDFPRKSSVVMAELI